MRIINILCHTRINGPTTGKISIQIPPKSHVIQVHVTCQYLPCTNIPFKRSRIGPGIDTIRNDRFGRSHLVFILSLSYLNCIFKPGFLKSRLPLQNSFFGIFFQFFGKAIIQIEHDRLFRFSQNSLDIAIHILRLQIPFRNDRSFFDPVRITSEIIIIQRLVPHPFIGITNSHTSFRQKIDMTFNPGNILIHDPGQRELHSMIFFQHFIHENHFSTTGLFVPFQCSTGSFI